MFNIGKNQKPKLVAETPTIETLPEDNAKQGFVEVDIFFEFRSLIAPYLRDFITTAYEFGMRSGELKQLKWDHVDRNGWCINLPGTITKNKKGRTIPLTTELKRRFQELWEYKQKKGIKLPFVFLNKNESGPMGDFRDDWNEVCRKLGIGYGYKTSKDYVEQWEKTFKPGPTLHDLRRSAVINNDRAGLSSAVNRNIIGHLTPEMFDRYRIVPFSDLENGMKQLEAYKKSRLNEYSKAKKEKQR
jgi:integrase